MEHFNQKEVISYVNESLSEAEQIQADLHITECKSCQRTIRTALFIRDSFETIWEYWSADQHGIILRQLKMIEALRENESLIPTFKENALSWLNALKSYSQIGLKILYDATNKLSSIGKLPLPVSHTFSFQPVVQGIAAAEELVELENHRKKSCSLLSKGNYQEAFTEIKNASKINARLVQGSIGTIECNQKIEVEVLINSRRKLISVKYWPSTDKHEPTLVFLIPSKSSGKPLVAEFQKVSNQSFLLAEFRNISDGCFDVLIEPTTRK